MRSFLQVLIFTLALAVAIEMCLRIMHFGTVAFSPAKMNSYTLIMNSDLVQPAQNPDVYYELKPNLDALFRGTVFTTNSNGLADKEYAHEKAADVFRVVVIGSSWTMATGVDVKDNYPSVIEELLKGQSQQNVEVINFAVEYYGFGEIIATLKDKALAYDPDMIIIASTSLTPLILWEDNKEAFTNAEETAPFSQSYLLSAAMGLVGKTAYKKRRRAKVAPNSGAYMRQVKRAMQEFKVIADDKGIPGVFIWLTHEKINETMLTASENLAKKSSLKFISINLESEATRKAVTEELILDMDTHPNETGHRLIAEKLYEELWSEETGTIKP